MADDNPYAEFADHVAAAPVAAPQAAPAVSDNPYAEFASHVAAAPPPPPQREGGYLRNLGAGLEEGITGLGSLIAGGGANEGGIPATDPRLDPAKTIPQTVHLINQASPLNPETVGANTFGEKFSRNLGSALPTMIAPSAGLANAARVGATGLASVLGQTAAQEYLPDSSIAQMIGAGVAGGLTGAATKVPSMVRRAITPISDADRAAAYVHETMQNAGKTPEMLDAFGSDTPNKPFIGAEAIGPPGITNARALGLRQGQTGSNLGPLLLERGEGTGQRLLDDFAQGTGINPAAAKGDIQTVVATGQKAARPLYEKAFAGGSSAPFEHSFEQENDRIGRAVNDAQQKVNDAQTQMTLAEAKVHNAGDNVYAANSALADRRTAQSALDDAEGNLSDLHSQQETIDTKLQKAQADKASGIRGGVWSPRLQQFLDDPEFGGFMAKGLQVQRREALANGERFNPKDYAITGIDADGAPIIGGVPNMRLLDAAKRGIDATLEAYRNPITGRLPLRDENVKALTDVRSAYLKELDNLNPDYSAARSESADYLSAETAFQKGQQMAKSGVSYTDFANHLKSLAPDDAEAFKGGVANHLFDQSEQGYLKAGTFAKPRMRQKVSLLMQNPEATTQFLKNVQAEGDMAKAGARMNPGVNSTTFKSGEATRNQNEWGAAANAARAGSYLLSGHPLRAAGAGMQALGNLGYGFAKTPGMSVGTRDAAGELLQSTPQELAARMREYGATQLAQQLAKPKFPKQGMIPAALPALQNNNQPYRKGGMIA